MLCEFCNQTNATCVYMLPNDNKLKYLCGKCYREVNKEKELDNFAYSQTKDLEEELKCKNCGTSFDEFVSTQLFGCPECYNVFANYIVQEIFPLFSNSTYLGKKPDAFYLEKDIKNIEQLIEICLKNKNFQKATEYGIKLEQLKAEKYGKL